MNSSSRQLSFQTVIKNYFYNFFLSFQRVEIFYQHVEADRQRLGLARSGSSRCPASYITVHRGHILEDGYAQLSQLTTDAMKGTIRVKFINEQVAIR